PLGSSDPQAIAAGAAAGPATPASDTLWLTAGPSVGLAETLDLVNGDASWSEASVGEINRVVDLPTDALGYDSFDAVVLVAGEWLRTLTPDDPRVRALRAWVARGGRLVLSCGRLGPELLVPGGALAELAPIGEGTPQTLAVADAIEAFAEAPAAAGRIELSAAPLAVWRVSLPGGAAQVLASSGRGGGATPLVVRAPVGFGVVTFVAFDLDAALIARWKGRATLLARLLGETPRAAGERPNYDSGEEIVDAIVDRLDRTLSQVWSPPFLLIVGLTIAYLLLVGPGDYYLVKRIIGRVEATWVTFPLIVLVTSAAAYGAAYWLKGDRVRVNQFELVNIESESGAARGLLLTHVFSPRAQRYDLSLAAREPSGAEYGERLTASDTAWFGRSGGGLGGMGGGPATGVVGRGPSIGYRVDPTPLLSPLGRATITGMPISVWSTKTLVSRYAGRTERAVVAELAATGDGLVTGAVTNDSGARLTDCRLLYGRWAWKLGELADGQTATVESAPSPTTRKTMLSKLGSGRNATLADRAARLSLRGSTDGRDRLKNRVAAGMDVTRRLDAGDAVLLATIGGDARRSELVRVTPSGDPAPLVPESSSESADAAPAHQSWTFVRFILPVDDG
ncbi:MAG: hypothetical protein AAF805_13070, partial [Planctomycetota bacterium]